MATSSSKNGRSHLERGDSSFLEDYYSNKSQTETHIKKVMERRLRDTLRETFRKRKPAVDIQKVGHACRALRDPFNPEEVQRGLTSLLDVEERKQYVDFVLRKRNEAKVAKVFRVLPTVRNFSKRCSMIIERKKQRPKMLPTDHSIPSVSNDGENEAPKIAFPLYQFHGYKKFAFFEEKTNNANNQMGSPVKRSTSNLRTAKTANLASALRGDLSSRITPVDRVSESRGEITPSRRKKDLHLPTATLLGKKIEAAGNDSGWLSTEETISSRGRSVLEWRQTPQNRLQKPLIGRFPTEREISRKY